MLMAAGLGTRLRPFTDVLPKPLVPLLGVPVAGFALQALARAGIRNVTANVHHLPGQTRSGLAVVAAANSIRCELKFSDETQQLLGSAGGIRRAMQFFEGQPFVITNADTICSLDIAKLVEAHFQRRQTHGATMTLALLEREVAGEETYRELQVDSSGERILQIGERSRSGLMYCGIAVLDPKALAGVPEDGPADFVETILRPEVAAGRAGAFCFRGKWMDVGSPKLWWRAHLELIRDLEAGDLPDAWSEFLRESIDCVGSDGCYVRRGARGDFSRWRGPGFWDGRGVAPRDFGPESVRYGEPTAEVHRVGGFISHDDMRVDFGG